LNFIPQSIPDVLLIEPTVHGDSRGYFMESFRQDLLNDFLGYEVNFVQDNESKSAKGVLRGLHYQLPPSAQAKLVRVIEGRVLDVAVDIRQSSPTFGQYVSKELSSDNHHQLFIPRGFAHGFVVLSESAVFAYKVDNYYSPNDDRGIAFDDPEIDIDWVLKSDELQLSDKDKSQPVLSEVKELFK
jgi:dTDP-4-dehydrorhamnose 3,5-epimerase